MCLLLLTGRERERRMKEVKDEVWSGVRKLFFNNQHRRLAKDERESDERSLSWVIRERNCLIKIVNKGEDSDSTELLFEFFVSVEDTEREVTTFQ